MTERAQQVANFMRERIESGAWRPHRRVPSQSELANQLKVSARAVAHATADLRRRGYLWTLPHKGNYTRPPEDWQQGPA
jgi:DNA-binding GntR family transcriptional regulator